MKRFDTGLFDRLIEILSAILVVLAVAAVAVGFIRLSLEHWGYLVLLAVVVAGAIFMLRKAETAFSRKAK